MQAKRHSFVSGDDGDIRTGRRKRNVAPRECTLLPNLIGLLFWAGRRDVG
jgi:hypothetical protein